MIRKVADNIISPLGFTTAENFAAVTEGKSALSLHADTFGLPEPFYGALINRDAVIERLKQEHIRYAGLTYFERLCVLSVATAIKDTAVDPSSAEVVFILSSTKGNVDALEDNPQAEEAYLGESARRIAHYFSNPNVPLVVSNACISGVCAQVAAVRKLLSGKCRYAIIVGADTLSRFIVSGFQSFKALSQEACRPYDAQRSGLNLGEAAATMVLQRVDELGHDDWVYVHSSIHNDANHISGPSRTGEGAFRVLCDLLTQVDREQLAFVNAHGTATNYNDEMESIAIHRAALDDVPVNGLKGFYGHTLGAAGLVETIMSMQAIDHNLILQTPGYESCGTTYQLNLSSQTRPTDKTSFIKILSGFGGSNAGIAYRKGGGQ